MPSFRPYRRGLLGLALGLSLAGFAGQPASARTSARLQPLEVVTDKGAFRFQVEFVDNDRDRERGLMFRKILAPDRGMLFDFKTERPVAFWMKNTFIPLDIVYIRADGTVFSIVRNAVPQDKTPLPSGGPIRGVLEIPGGRAGEIGLLPGDRVRHRIFPGG